MKRCRGLVDMYLKLLEFEESLAEGNDSMTQMGNETDDRNLRGGYPSKLFLLTVLFNSLVMVVSIPRSRNILYF